MVLPHIYKIITYSPSMWPLLFLPRLFLLMMISTVDTHTTLIATPPTVAAVVATAIVVLPFPGVVDTTAVCDTAAFARRRERRDNACY